MINSTISVSRERVDTLSLDMIQLMDGLPVEVATLAALLTAARVYTGEDIPPDRGVVFLQDALDWLSAYWATDGRES